MEFRLPGGKCSDPEQEPSENYFALEGKWQLLTDGTRFKIKGDTQLEQMKELEDNLGIGMIEKKSLVLGKTKVI